MRDNTSEALDWGILDVGLDVRGTGRILFCARPLELVDGTFGPGRSQNDVVLAAEGGTARARRNHD